MAAENILRAGRAVAPAAGFNEAAANGRGKPPPIPPLYRVRNASMRPRRMAAENLTRQAGFEHVRGASMRPRRMAAENGLLRFVERLAQLASMRPRRMAAENGSTIHEIDVATMLQ